MEYQALYRKFRPTTFDQVIGQKHIISTLSNQINSGQISHAYLFCGTRGTGKTSIAKIFAKAINCENRVGANPCGKCPTCLSLNESSNLDIFEIDAASNNGVEYIRDLRENVKYPPIVAKYKVYIIDEVHMLSESAFNALLKTLEEPPKYVVFILATTEVHKLPATILSRLLRLDFKLIPSEELENQLISIFDKEEIKYEKEAISLIAKLGEGSDRDMLSIADMCVAYSNKNVTYNSVIEATGSTNKEILHLFATSILKKDISSAMQIINNLCESGKNIAQLNKDLQGYFRDLAIIKTCKTFENILHYPANLLKLMADLAKDYDANRILDVLKNLSGLEQEFRFTNNARYLFEITILNLLDNSN